MSAAAGSPPATQAAQEAWRSVRRSGDLQFAPVPDWTPAPAPDWMKALTRFLRDLFEPVGRALGLSWPVVEKILLVLAVAGAVLLIWRVGTWLWTLRRPPASPAPAWSPDAQAARALLADADALAAQGRFDEATHLLLLRSLDHIAAAHPGALTPASTAREIGAQTFLSATARATFGLLAGLVEQGRYALRPLGANDWQSARAAYADFTGQSL